MTRNWQDMAPGLEKAIARSQSLSQAEYYGDNMQPIIHQSPTSSVKIDTDAKGNAKPSVHVYDADPGEAAKVAVTLYEWVKGEVNPEEPAPANPPPPDSPVWAYMTDELSVVFSFFEGQEQVMDAFLARMDEAALHNLRMNIYKLCHILDGAMASRADQEYAEVDEEASLCLRSREEDVE